MAEESTNALSVRASENCTVATASRQDVAAYVATLARDLKRMVERHDLATLTYLLELVQLEASRNCGRPRALD